MYTINSYTITIHNVQYNLFSSLFKDYLDVPTGKLIRFHNEAFCAVLMKSYRRYTQ